MGARLLDPTGGGQGCLWDWIGPLGLGDLWRPICTHIWPHRFLSSVRSGRADPGLHAFSGLLKAELVS